MEKLASGKDMKVVGESEPQGHVRAGGVGQARARARSWGCPGAVESPPGDLRGWGGGVTSEPKSTSGRGGLRSERAGHAEGNRAGSAGF